MRLVRVQRLFALIDPLADITNTRRITGVMLNGRYFDRSAIDSLLAAAERAARQGPAARP